MSNTILAAAKARGAHALSEANSRAFLEPFGLPFPAQRRSRTREDVVAAAREVGFPVVLKGSGARLLHKTEAGVVHLDLRDDDAVLRAWDAIRVAAGDLVEEALVQRFIPAKREFVVGLMRDPQFGPAVMFGLGGIFTEAMDDVAFAIAPLSDCDARDLMYAVRAKTLLGAVRGLKPVREDLMIPLLKTIGQIGLDCPDVQSLDLNPVRITDDGEPVIVDALITL